MESARRSLPLARTGDQVQIQSPLGHDEGGNVDRVQEDGGLVLRCSIGLDDSVLITLTCTLGLPNMPSILLLTPGLSIDPITPFCYHAKCRCVDNYNNQ